MRISFILLSFLLITPSFAQSNPASLPVETNSEEIQENTEIDSETSSNSKDSFQRLSIPKKKSREKAIALSVGTTVGGFVLSFGGTIFSGLCDVCPVIGAPMALIGSAGVLVGPSMGHFYSGAVGHGLGTTTVRFVSSGVAGLGGAILILDALGQGSANNSLITFATVSLITGASIYTGFLVYGLIDSAFVVERREKRRKRKLKKYNLSLLPAPMRTPEGKTNLGLLLSGTF